MYTKEEFCSRKTAYDAITDTPTTFWKLAWIYDVESRNFRSFFLNTTSVG